MKPKTYTRLLCSVLLSGWITGCATLPSERAITITPVSLLTPDTLSRIHVDATLHIPSKALSNRSRLIVRPRLLQGNSPISEYPVMAFDAPITLNRLDIYDMASADGLSYAFNTTLARNRALAAKEGLVGPLVDGVVDDAVLYGRLINIKNPLAYTSSPNVAYDTHYAFLNLTLDDYGTSDASDPVTVEAKLDPTLMTSDLLSNLLGDLLGGDLLGLLLSPLLETVTEVLRTTTFALDIKLPDLGIHNIVIEGGWDPTTSSID